MTSVPRLVGGTHSSGHLARFLLRLFENLNSSANLRLCGILDEFSLDFLCQSDVFRKTKDKHTDMYLDNGTGS